jgi:hypothetical protein
MRIVDTLIVFRILKLLTTKFEKTKAFKLGLIDKDGNRIKDKKVESKEEKEAFTLLHRLVFNLKRIIAKVPFGKTAFASYAVALLLLKEHAQLTDDQGEELYEKFYRHLKDNDLLNPEEIVEAVEFDKLEASKTYRLRRQLKQNFNEDYNIIVHPEKSEVLVRGEYAKVYGITIYEAYCNTDRVYICADDVY